MTEGRVEVISREIIKPSSQTPPHLKNLKFSYIDKLVGSIYVPLIFFYQADESKGLTRSNHVQISKHLKQSLSDTLPSFYPLAGRKANEEVVDCNDAGVEFIDARAHAHLMDVIQQPNMEELKQYIPLDLTKALGLTGEEIPLLLVQITFFDCGGIVLGACFAHRVADLASATAFFNAWAATCRGEPQISHHFSFGTSSYFPPTVLPNSGSGGFSISDEKLRTKRLVFDKEKLALLKKAAATSSTSSTIIKNPTRVELVSAFIWKHFIELAKSKNPQKRKIFGASHAVNLRKRTSPPQLLENVFGNCVMPTLAICDQQDEGVEDFHDLVSKLRSAIRRVRDDYITKPQNEDSFVNDLSKLSSLLATGELELCSFSSWCGFAVYEVDFGWGKPIWLSTTAPPIKNGICLLNSRSGDGIEALVIMTQDDLQKFETQILTCDISMD